MTVKPNEAMVLVRGKLGAHGVQYVTVSDAEGASDRQGSSIARTVLVCCVGETIQVGINDIRMD